MDLWSVERAFRDLDRALPDDVREEFGRELKTLEREIYAIECEKAHCEDGNCQPDYRADRALDIVDAKLLRIRLGVYNQLMDGNLREILEEIEEALN